MGGDQIRLVSCNHDDVVHPTRNSFNYVYLRFKMLRSGKHGRHGLEIWLWNQLKTNRYQGCSTFKWEDRGCTHVVHKNKQDRGERRDSDRFADAESTHVKCVCFCTAVAIEYRYVYPSCINTKSRWTDGDEGGMETEPSGLNNADHVTRIRALWPSLLAEKTLFPHVLNVVTMPGFRPVHCLNGAAARGSCR